MFMAEGLGTNTVTAPHLHLIITSAVSNARSPKHCLDLHPHLRNGLRQLPHTRSDLHAKACITTQCAAAKSSVFTSPPTFARVIGMDNSHDLKSVTRVFLDAAVFPGW